MLNALADKIYCLSRFGEVCGDADNLVTCKRADFFNRFRQFLIIQCTDCDFRALFAKFECGRFAQSFACSGHKGHFVFQTEVHTQQLPYNDLLSPTARPKSILTEQLFASGQLFPGGLTLCIRLVSIFSTNKSNCFLAWERRLNEAGTYSASNNSE